MGKDLNELNRYWLPVLQAHAQEPNLQGFGKTKEQSGNGCGDRPPFAEDERREREIAKVGDVSELL